MAWLNKISTVTQLCLIHLIWSGGRRRSRYARLEKAPIIETVDKIDVRLMIATLYANILVHVKPACTVTVRIVQGQTFSPRKASSVRDASLLLSPQVSFVPLPSFVLGITLRSTTTGHPNGVAARRALTVDQLDEIHLYGVSFLSLHTMNCGSFFSSAR